VMIVIVGRMRRDKAGQKGKIVSRLKEISLLFQVVGGKRLNWCLDSGDAFGAGSLWERLGVL